VSVTHIDREARIREIVAHGPPKTAIDESYLSSAFARLETLQYFLAAADSNVWLRWCAERGDLDVLWTESDESDTDKAYAWARWACRSMAGPDPELLFRVVHQRGGGVSDALWSAIWRNLVSAYPQSAVAGRYLSLLLQGESPSRRLELSLLLLEAQAEDRVGAMRLLEWAVTPVARLEKSPWSLSEDYDVGMDFDLNGDGHHARVAWNRLQPLTLEESERMMLYCLGLLASASQAHRHFTGRPLDPISASRSAIERHDQDAYGDRYRLLVDVARESVRGQAEQDPRDFLPVLKWMLKSDSGMIKRLALDAMVYADALEPDSAVRLLVDQRLLFASGLKHEVYRLLAAAYSRASQAAKGVLLKAALGESENDSIEPSDYERYNLLVWLSGMDSTDRATSEALARLQKANPTFAARESPDFDSFFFESKAHDADEAPASDRLTKESPESIVELVCGFKGVFPNEWLRELTLAAASAQWTEKLLKALAENAIWAEELWDVLFQSLVKSGATKNVAGLLEVLAQNPSRKRYLYEVSMLLSQAWSTKRSQKSDELHATLGALYGLWQSVAADASTSEDDQETDSFVRARSSVRGRLALHYLEGMGVLARIAPEVPVLSGEVRDVMESMLGSERDPDSLIIIAGSTGWFLSEDEQWADTNLLPLFDWVESVDTAAPVWSGFLNAGTWSSRSVERLSEWVRTGYPWVSRHLPDAMDAFAGHHSFLYTSGLLPYDDPAWADAFTVSATSEEREGWIDSISRRYRDSEPSPEAWRRLHNYWSRRTRDTPLGLGGNEVNALLSWLLLTPTALPETLSILLDSPVPIAPDGGARLGFNYDRLPVNQYPKESGKALARILQGCVTGAWIGDGIEAVVRNIGRLGARDEAMSLVNELVRLGVAGPTGWRDLIDDASAE